MIEDMREIRFEAEALIAVVAGSPRAAAAFGLSRGMPQGILFEPRRQSVRFVFPGGGGSQSVELEAAKLAALLVGYCLRLRIPLPRKAEKSIRVDSGMVVLAFRTEIRPSLNALAPEGRAAPGEAPAAVSWGS